MKFFKSPLFVAVLTVFLGVFFISIVFMQSKNTPTVDKNLNTVQKQPTNQPQQDLSTAKKSEEPITSEQPISFSKVEEKTTTEKQQVLVSFLSEDNKQITSKEVPLYEITKVEKGSEPAKIVSY